MSSHFVRTALAVALAFAAGCGGSKAASSSVGDSTIAQYFAAIDNGFADLKGKQFGDNPIVTKFLGKLTIPNTNACAISHIKQSGETVATCFYVSASQSEADAAYVAAKQQVRAALPALSGKDESPTNGNIAQYFAQDGKRAVYVDEGQQDDGKYTVVTSFGTVKALQ
ncbi:MAG TPA: hypothetical protein VK760_05240 [Candidatus Acidoferrales bacterium]|jgi:hypothetical protein|nr:hypothetical protein [Candidatus Acidoferrales bacterium]